MLKVGGIYKEKDLNNFFIIVSINHEHVDVFDIYPMENIVSNEIANTIIRNNLKYDQICIYTLDASYLQFIADGYLGQINDAHLYKLQQHLQGMINDGFLISSNVPFA